MTNYGDARRVEYVTYTPYETHESERKYVPVDNVRGSVQEPYEPYSYRETRVVDLTLYLDPETGLVVYDVEAYEKNLKAQREGLQEALDNLSEAILRVSGKPSSGPSVPAMDPEHWYTGQDRG